MRSLTLYTESIIDAPLLNLLSLLAEVQLFKDWIPFMRLSDLEGEKSPFRKLAHFICKLPWPFKAREIYL